LEKSSTWGNPKTGFSAPRSPLSGNLDGCQF
jgi:hypothetical protein